MMLGQSRTIRFTASRREQLSPISDCIEKERESERQEERGKISATRVSSGRHLYIRLELRMTNDEKN